MARLVAARPPVRASACGHRRVGGPPDAIGALGRFFATVWRRWPKGRQSCLAPTASRRPKRAEPRPSKRRSGLLAPFLADDAVVEIMVNADGSIWVERIGRGMRSLGRRDARDRGRANAPAHRVRDAGGDQRGEPILGGQAAAALAGAPSGVDPADRRRAHLRAPQTGQGRLQPRRLRPANASSRRASGTPCSPRSPPTTTSSLAAGPAAARRRSPTRFLRVVAGRHRPRAHHRGHARTSMRGAEQGPGPRQSEGAYVARCGHGGHAVPARSHPRRRGPRRLARSNCSKPGTPVTRGASRPSTRTTRARCSIAFAS